MNTLAIIEDRTEDIEFIRQQLNHVSSWLLLGAYRSVAECISKKGLTKQPKFILLDIYLDGMISVDRIPDIRRAFPSAVIIIYSISENYDSLIRAFQNGALGYFVKTADTASFHSQLQILEQDGSIISPQMARTIATQVRKKVIRFNATNKLSDKDVQTLHLLAIGRTYKQIAEAQSMSVEGVRSRIRRMYEKLNVTNRWEAINKFKKWNTI